MYDVIIIGAGIIGSFLAHDLSKLNCKVAVIDKNADIADSASMANSAIVHAGHDPEDGTLKALLNVEGNRMYRNVCKELNVTFKEISAFVVSTCEEENDILSKLYKRATSRNIPCMVIGGEEARKKEKNLSKSVVRALELPTTGIIYPWEVAIALMEEAVLNGTDLYLNEEVIGIEKKDNFIVHTANATYESVYVINAAGIYADQVYQMVLGKKEHADFHITPKRGEYFVLDQLKEPLVNRVIYPVPGPSGKGVLVIPTTYGNTLLGPNSEIIADKEGINNTFSALEYVKQNVKKTVENIPFDKVIRTFAGLRPSTDSHDFIIEESKLISGFVNVACIESPGLASAPAISRYILNHVMNDKFVWDRKEGYVHRKKSICMADLNEKEKNDLIRVHPEYGEIVCRCEQISKGEIIDCIRRTVGATTVKGVKKRVRPGMGRCQGGFCEPLVVEILSEELGISPLDVRLDSKGSVLFTGKTKGDSNP